MSIGWHTMFEMCGKHPFFRSRAPIWLGLSVIPAKLALEEYISYKNDMIYTKISENTLLIIIYQMKSWTLPSEVKIKSLKSWTIHQQLWSLLVLCKILSHFKALTPSKSMPRKINHDFTERYPNIKAGTYKPMRIRDILTKNRFVCRTPAF